MSKTFNEVNKPELSAMQKFLKAVIDIATQPQVLKEWIKERKAWRHSWSVLDKKVKISDKIEIIKVEKKNK